MHEGQPKGFTASGKRIEELSGMHRPEDIFEKLSALEDADGFFDQALNHEGLSREQVTLEFLQTLSPENLKGISSLIGDIRLHHAAPAITKEFYNKIALILRDG